MNEDDICIYCNKTIKKCRKDDIKLSNLSHEPQWIKNLHMFRYHKAFAYKLNLFDSKDTTDHKILNRIYNLPLRLSYDTYLSLPLCVWENNDLRYHYYSYMKQIVIDFNVYKLPINKIYHNLILKYFQDVYNESNNMETM